uniref:Uncharacterized protein n=1 Tax=Strigamia maritima TaxID=126957 RepID=T1IL10_STRMM
MAANFNQVATAGNDFTVGGDVNIGNVTYLCSVKTLQNWTPTVSQLQMSSKECTLIADKYHIMLK